MIQVTLSFNSIALAVAALAKIDAESVTIAGTSISTAKESSAGKSAPATQAKPAAGKGTAKVADAPASTDSAPAQAAAVSAETAQPASTAVEAAPPTIDYALLKAAVFELSGKNQPKLAEIAASFGVKTFKDLAPAKWADALAAVKGALAPAAVEDEAFA